MRGSNASPTAAGVDVGKRKHGVAVAPSRFEEQVRSFGSFTDELEALAAWLSARGVREVAMESTAVYGSRVFDVLDRAGLEVHLVNPRVTKQVQERRADCQWIRQLTSFGLLRGAFRAPDALCPMRSYLRQRGQLVRDRSRGMGSAVGSRGPSRSRRCTAHQGVPQRRPARFAQSPTYIRSARPGGAQAPVTRPTAWLMDIGRGAPSQCRTLPHFVWRNVVCRERRRAQ